jgi:hypothetical protein
MTSPPAELMAAVDPVAVEILEYSFNMDKYSHIFHSYTYHIPLDHILSEKIYQLHQ